MIAPHHLPLVVVEDSDEDFEASDQVTSLRRLTEYWFETVVLPGPLAG